MKIRMAVTPPAAALDAAVFGAYLNACERLGFDTVWLSDIPLGPLGDPIVSLSYAAASTTKLKLGANIVPLGRNPLWLAKQLAQLDRLCGGRLLLSFVPGLGAPAERAALGHTDDDRGREVDTMIALLRRWWAGEAVTASYAKFKFDEVTVQPTPVQRPLEIWLGGIAPAALARVARVADGWLTSAATPQEAAAGRQTIERHAAACARTVDPEHFGISIPYSFEPPPEAALTGLRQRRRDRDLTDIVAVGPAELRRLIDRYLAAGLSKFVLRPMNALDRAADWHADLTSLADVVLPLQT